MIPAPPLDFAVPFNVELLAFDRCLAHTFAGDLLLHVGHRSVHAALAYAMLQAMSNTHVGPLSICALRVSPKHYVYQIRGVHQIVYMVSIVPASLTWVHSTV